MSAEAHVVEFMQAQCFECGWEGERRSYWTDADADARLHDELHHRPADLSEGNTT